MEFDFSGWATRNDLQCSDGRTIRKDAFKNSSGQKVPLVWNHQHNDSLNVLGHALLENKPEGVYAYGKFNDTESGQNAKLLVEHGDVSALSIYANQLKQQGGNVLHGAIREVSLVLSGANPGAYIDSVIRHGEESEEEAVIFTGEELILFHADEEEDKDKEDEEEESKDDESEETVADVFETLSEKQKTVVYALIGQALEDDKEKKEEPEEQSKPEAESTKDEGDDEVKHNIFENEEQKDDNFLSHAEMQAIFTDAKKSSSLKETVLAHGITNIDYLFPDAKNLNPTPAFIKRDTTWVGKVMSGVHNTPFSRIKSTFANLTEADARAKGYIKGEKKVEETFSLLKRTTTPQTIYKKQKLDRDDVIDIVDFDVVAWLKTEMRMMLDEEIARATLIGDGRLASSDDKINETNIRPIWTDADLYTVKHKLDVLVAATAEQKAKAFIKAAVKSRKNYKGSGRPTLFTTEDMLTDMLLLEDTTGRVIYESEDKLATALRVSEIVTVPVMEGATREVADATHQLLGLIVNLNDYNIGADKGGAVNMFDDFDIDYNAQKYLIETRCSGALTVPYSAIAIEVEVEVEVEDDGEEG